MIAVPSISLATLVVYLGQKLNEENKVKSNITRPAIQANQKKVVTESARRTQKRGDERERKREAEAKAEKRVEARVAKAEAERVEAERAAAKAEASGKR